MRRPLLLKTALMIALSMAATLSSISAQAMPIEILAAAVSMIRQTLPPPMCVLGAGLVNSPVGTNDARDPFSPVSKMKSEQLSPDHEPDDLVRVPDIETSPEVRAKYAGKYFETLRRPTLRAATALLNYAHAEGIDLSVHSGYRSYASQCEVFNNKLKDEFLRTPTLKVGDKQSESLAVSQVNSRSALPGQSEHQLGTAIDFVTNIPGVGYKLERDMDRTPAFDWMSKNAHRFGFVMTYPKGAAAPGKSVNAYTGYVYEPWHWRYIGIQAATDYQGCQALGYTTQDYLRSLKKDPTFSCNGAVGALKLRPIYPPPPPLKTATALFRQ